MATPRGLLAFAMLIAKGTRELQLPLRAGLGGGGVHLAADHAQVAASETLAGARKGLTLTARREGREERAGFQAIAYPASELIRIA